MARPRSAHLFAAAIIALLIFAATPGPAHASESVSGSAVRSAESSATTPSVEPTPSAPATPVVPIDTRPRAPKFVKQTGKAIYIDRKRQTIYLYVDGRQIDKFRCSTSSTLPRRGTYFYRFKRPGSSSFNGAVTFSWQTVFTVGPHGHNIAFHSIPVNHAGRIIAPVGRPVSHGCVRVEYPKAKFIYRWITKKTPIVVRP